MSFKNFVPAIWSAVILEELEKSLVFAGPGAVNRDYEGEIRQVGDRVIVNSISDPTIAPYTTTTVITPEDLTPADQELVVDQMNYFAFKVNDVDRVQTAGGGKIMTTGMKRAAYKLRDTVDLYVAALWAQAATANQITTTSITTPALALQYISELGVKLDEANVPREGRYCIIPPWYHGLLRRDDAFDDSKAAGTGTDAVVNGTVGRAEGFDIKLSNNVTLVTGDDYRVCAGVDAAISYAEQINEVEPYRPESSFADAVKGLHVYGAKVFRPTCMATLLASKT